ncbi:MAG: CoA-binding protein [Ginsengibacter sp.]
MKKEKKTLVLGASANPERFSNIAIRNLRLKGYEVVAIGNKKNQVKDVDILTEQVPIEDLDTITLYLNAQNQKPYYDYILASNPKRIIFNPGAENKELSKLAKEKGIQSLNACTLVMLSTGQF